MRAIFTSTLLITILTSIALNSCTDYAHKSKLLTEHGPAMSHFHEYYREFENRMGRKPASISEVIQKFPKLKSELDSYSCDFSKWTFHRKSEKGIILEVSDQGENEKLILMEGGNLLLK